MDLQPHIYLDAPSAVDETRGLSRRRVLHLAVRTWCQQQSGADMFVVDGWNIYFGSDGSIQYPSVGPFAANQVLADVVTWIRSLPFTPAQQLPIRYAERYAIGAQTAHGPNNAIKTAAAIRYLYAGGNTALNWTGTGDGTPAGGLWSSTLQSGGGQPKPWYTSAKIFHDYFAPGTTLLTISSSSYDVEALATPTKTLLVNTTSSTRTVSINDTTPVTLSPYQVTTVATPS